MNTTDCTYCADVRQCHTMKDPPWASVAKINGLELASPTPAVNVAYHAQCHTSHRCSRQLISWNLDLIDNLAEHWLPLILLIIYSVSSVSHNGSNFHIFKLLLLVYFRLRTLNKHINLMFQNIISSAENAES